MTKQGGVFEKAGKIILILALVSAGFFYLQMLQIWHSNYFKIKIVKADSSPDVVINEIAWMGTAVSASDEWMELKNMTDSEISLEGWTLVAQDGSPSINLLGSILANGHFLLERTNDDSVPGVTADLIYTGALGNDSGEVLKLQDSEDNLIDMVDASEGWPAGDNTNKLTMERTEDGLWQNSQNPGGTPRAPNSAGEEPEPEPYCGDGNLDEGEECDDGNNEDGDGCSADCQIEQEEEQPEEPEEPEEEEKPSEQEPEGKVKAINKLGEVLVNEFVSDPSDDDVEWIELYNATDRIIDLNGWTIEEGSGAKTSLEGSLVGSGDSKFIVIEKPKGNLNNKGDIIILRDNIATLIDQVTYGNWNDGNMENNAPVANDPFSVARRFDGHNTYNNANDFAITTTLTKGQSNVITSPEEEGVEEISEEEKAKYDYSNEIIISEIFPNPAGSDSESEFIELFNKGEREVNLLGWRLGDNSKKRYEFKIKKEEKEDDYIIKANGYFIIDRTRSKIALNNGSDSVKLFQPLKDEPLRVVKYEKAIEGWSYNYVNKEAELPIGSSASHNKWVWSEIVTPGTINEIKTVNHPPLVDFDCPEEVLVGAPIVFDSSDTIDEDGDSLIYFWNFGDAATNTLPCPEHTFFQAGAYTVKLTISDGEHEVEKEKIVRAMSSLKGDKANLTGPYPLTEAGLQGDRGIIINEFLPNPEGSDLEGEWIEIYNQGGTEINLLNWRLDDIEGGSRPFTFSDDFWLRAGRYFVMDRTESKLALNNSNEAVRLFSDLDELIDEVEYEKAIEGESYARGINDKWFWTTALTPGEDNIISVVDSESVIKVTRSLDGKTKKVKEKTVVETSLEKVKELEVGDLVKVTGIVAVLPGVLGAQYFYIVGSPGLQIYNYKKDFPNLKVGDYIEVQGELSMSSGELRLKTKTSDDFKVIEHREPPIANKLTCEKVNEENVGQLISVTGEVVERKSSIVYLDDGTDEILIYIKTATGINAKNIKEGEMMTVTGLLGRTKSGIRIMPRSIDDIIKKDPQTHVSTVGQVLGEVAVSDEWAIAQRDKKLELFKYLLILAGGVIIVLSGLLVKARA